MVDHRKEGFNFLRQALDCDENGSEKQLVQALYSLGIQELDKAIEKCKADDDSRIEMEMAKLKAKERLNYLNKSVRFTPPSKTHQEAKPAPSSLRRYMPGAAAEGGHRWEQSLRSYESPKSSRTKSNDRDTTRRDKTKSRHGPSAKEDDEVTDEIDAFIKSSIFRANTNVGFDDVIGLDKAKQSLRESVILPQMRPELFSGLRAPSQGLLLFGPPGNGKTLLVKALASETKGTLFNITAAAITSKWVGESEKAMKKLFDMARKKAPSIVFIDEIDSILSSRNGRENESSRKLKNEFFASFDGLASSQGDRILVIGATNRPGDIDSAAIRRFTKRIYIPLPDHSDRAFLIAKLLADHGNPLSASEINQVAKATHGYSSSDISNLCKDAAFGPVRELTEQQLASISPENLRPIDLSDFRSALTRVRVSVAKDQLDSLVEWNKMFGDVSL